MDKTIGLACNISTGKLDANQAVSGGEYPFFTCAEYPDKIDHFAYDDDVVLVAGNNARGNFHVSRYNGKFNAYQRTYILTAKEGFNIDYVYYALKLELKRLREKSQGSQTKFLTMPILTGIHFRDITGDEQKKVANVLTSIDKKIELNNRINSELEAMAKILYDYWFVQFDFPDANGKPYKSSGGKMVYNPILKREIPEGWGVITVGDYANVKKGTLITEKHANPKGNIKVVSAGLDYSYLHDEANISENAITISASGASAGFINFWREPIFACDCTVVKGRTTESTIYILNFLRMRQEFIYQQARGSAQPHVYPKDISGLFIEVPPSELMKKFGENVLAGNAEISNTLKQNEKLSKLRDFLLPMLMNGQVTAGE